eukprot:3594300-Amphidinium_carterae.1
MNGMRSTWTGSSPLHTVPVRGPRVTLRTSGKMNPMDNGVDLGQNVDGETDHTTTTSLGELMKSSMMRSSRQKRRRNDRLFKQQ